MLNIKHTAAFDLAFRYVTETNLNVFLTGKAGTGKTTFLKYLRENCFKKMVVAAPTGVAAINAGGSTLHSLFQLPLGPYIPVAFSNNSNNGFGAEVATSHSLLAKAHYSSEKLNIFRNLELLIIDEASMVAGYTVDAVDAILKSVRRRHAEPFGGVQVLFIGDLHQLQPVMKNQEWALLRDYYPSIFFFDSVVLRDHVPVMIELKEIFRQKDETFVDILNAVRNNNLTTEQLDLLNSRLNRNFTSDSDDDGYIILTTHNRQADNTNLAKLQKLNRSSKIYQATIEGDFPEHIYPAEHNLELKEGAQVMFLRNDVEEKKYFNGKIGVVTELGNDFIKVKCKGENKEIGVIKHEWKNVKYALNHDTREITEEEQGSFKQYPLRLAWAITIHKSQGLTFEKAVIDAANAFANGQVYVALSRCTSLEGLVLTSPINREYLGAHQDLKDWQQKNYDENNLEKKFHESRQQFIQQELQNIFTWKNWAYDLQKLGKVVEEFSESLPAESHEWLKQLSDKQKELDNVSGKFNDQVMRLCSENSIVENNQPLQERVRAAANYFSAEISTWQTQFKNHPLSADTKKVSRKVDDILDEINVTVYEILHRVNHCKNGFNLNDYLRAGKKLPPSAIEKVQSSYAQGQKKNIVDKESNHPMLYEMLAEMRRRIADETGQALYLVFSNKVMTNVCEALPGNTDSLLAVSGFGKSKVKKYGNEVIEIVRDYCEEYGLAPNERYAKALPSKPAAEKKPATVDETVKLFKTHKSIEQVAHERALAISTIETHLASAVKLKQIKIDELMPLEEARKIAQYFPQPLQEPVQLTPVKEKAPPEVSFGKLRMVLAWLQLEEKNNNGNSDDEDLD